MLNQILTDVAKRQASNYLDEIEYYTQMNSIGSFGKVIFKVSALGTMTPNDYQISFAAKVKKHSLINNPDITEHLGRELEKVSFGVKLIYTLTDIQRAVETFKSYCEKGEHFPLVLSGAKIGEHTFRIENFSCKYTKTDRIGTPLVAECSISLEEYIEDINTKAKPVLLSKGTNQLERKSIAFINDKVIRELTGVRLW